MVSVEVKANSPASWAFGHPWFWGLTGLGASLVAFVWVRALGDAMPWFRFTLVALGLLATMTAIWLRLQSSAAFLDAQSTPRRNTRITALLLLDLALAGGTTVLLIAHLLDGKLIPWPIDSLLWLWVAVVPWCAFRAFWLMRLKSKGLALGPALESSCLLTVAALAVFCTCWALYIGPEIAALECDTLRLLLAAAALALFLAAPLAASPSWLRRTLISVLLVLHLGGIVTAVLAAPPGPWLTIQVWTHFYRPYLEFMYLNNAYRFYAPEPAAATQLWFFLEFEDGKGNMHRHWRKLPNMDDGGRSRYTVGLQFQRRLALTENVTRTAPAPPFTVRDAAGKLQPAAFWKRRDDQSPTPESRGVLGQLLPPNPKGIPYHPDPQIPQYAPPDFSSKILLESYARHVLSLPHPSNPALKPVSVKIYRVVHRIVEPNLLAMGNDPQDLTFFLPYYQGKFDAEGELLDPEDPFLYWVIPIIRDDVTKPNSPIRAWVFKHAGDDDWVKMPGFREAPLGIR